MIVVQAILALTPISGLLGKELIVSILDEPTIMIYALVLCLFIGLLSGLYPAFYLSSFKPIEVLKARIGDKKNGITLRGVLVVGQFIISIFLILGTLVVYRQLNYIQNVNLGFNKEQIIILHGAGALEEKVETFKEQLLSYSNIKNVSIYLE